MSSAEDLLVAIREAPDDDEPRHVYADLLAAAGDPRGEYIAIDLALARADTRRGSRNALLRRRHALAEEHGDSWWPELPARRVHTHRGFADRLMIYPSEFGIAAPLFEREPITALDLLDVPDGVGDASWMDRIETVELHGYPTGIERMFASRLGRAITTLALNAGDTPMGGVPFASHLPNCRTLRMSGTSMRLLDPAEPIYVHELGSTLDSLIAWQHVSQLEVLELVHCEIGPRECGRLRAANLAALRVLSLAANPIDDDCARALHDLPSLVRLELGAGFEVPRQWTIELGSDVIDLTSRNGFDYAIACNGTELPIRVRTRAGARVEDTVMSRAPLVSFVRQLALGDRVLKQDRGVSTPDASSLRREQHLVLTAGEVLYEVRAI